MSFTQLTEVSLLAEGVCEVTLECSDHNLGHDICSGLELKLFEALLEQVLKGFESLHFGLLRTFVRPAIVFNS